MQAVNNAVRETLSKFGSDIVSALQKALPETVDASGRLRGSIQFSIIRLGAVWKFELRLADYWKALDEGIPPGKVHPSKFLINSLMKWIELKGFHFYKGELKSGKVQGRSYKKQRISNSAQQTVSLAYAIAKNMEMKGTYPFRKDYRTSYPHAAGFYSHTVTPVIIDKLKEDLVQAMKPQLVADVKELITK